MFSCFILSLRLLTDYGDDDDNDECNAQKGSKSSFFFNIKTRY